MKQTHERFPRPAGLTLLCRNLNSTNPTLGPDYLNYENRTQLTPDINPPTNTVNTYKVLKKRIRYYVLNHYITNGYTFNHTPLTIEELALFLRDEVYVVIKDLHKVASRNFKVYAQEDIKDMLQGLIGLATHAQISVLAKAQYQTSVLTRSQQGTYKPYLSATLNQALANEIGATKPIIETLKLFMGGVPNKSTPFANSGEEEQPTNSKSESLTTEGALLLLEEKAPAIRDYEAEFKYQTEGDAPEIRAAHQTNGGPEIRLKIHTKHKTNIPSDDSTTEHNPRTRVLDFDIPDEDLPS